MKLCDNTKFKKRVYLYTLELSPEIYNPNILHKPVKNGASISPVIYSPEDFTPYKSITIQFSPEAMQDAQLLVGESIEDQLHKILQDILDNPKDYTPKGDRAVMIRGVFEEYERDDATYYHNKSFKELKSSEPNANTDIPLPEIIEKSLASDNIKNLFDKKEGENDNIKNWLRDG